VAYDVNGERVTEMPPSQSDFHHARPVYEYLEGWSEDITGARTFADLPRQAQVYVRRLEELCGAPISGIGVGPDREESIMVRDLL
jgi:adenylosuccinate synthase